MAKRPRGRPQKWGGSDEEAQVFTLRLPRSLHAALRTYANLQGRPVNDVLRDAIEAFWSKCPEAPRINRLVRDAGTRPRPDP